MLTLNYKYTSNTTSFSATTVAQTIGFTSIKKLRNLNNEKELKILLIIFVVIFIFI